MRRLALMVQVLLGRISCLWVISYFCYLLFEGSHLVEFSAFILFIFTYHSIWIWFVYTIIISLTAQKIMLKKTSSILFIGAAACYIAIFIIDPGGYLEILLN